MDFEKGRNVRGRPEAMMGVGGVERYIEFLRKIEETREALVWVLARVYLRYGTYAEEEYKAE